VSDFDQAFDFMIRADMAGSRVEPFRFGKAVFTPELPLRHDSNYLLVETLPDDASAADLVEEAERAQGAAGLEHRLLLFRDAALGERFAPELVRLGWHRDRHVLMAQRRQPERATATRIVSEVAEATLRAARERQILSYPWGTPEVARQLLDAKRRIPVDARYFAVLVDGAVASYGDLYMDGHLAQVEDVATMPEHRGRGYASAVVLHAADEARAAGAELVFLVADDEDWPKHLYGRLGFEEIGANLKLLRTTKVSSTPPQATGGP
jgi:ribosomal protein S18 acetylase RimI-like enzyme